MTAPAELLPTVWLMFIETGHFYPIQPSTLCKAEDHAALNPHLIRIESEDGKVLWQRTVQ